jgi:ABC-type multidrug transport system ATPase subunit
MSAEDYVIECQGLNRKFGNFTAVDSLNLRIRKGEFFGFLGPNGAGKTTTIRMLTTLLSPTNGWATVAGFDVTKEAASVRNWIGVVPQEFALFEDPSGEKFSDTADFVLSVRVRSFVEQILDYWYLLALVAVIALVVIVRRIAGGRAARGKKGGA